MHKPKVTVMIPTFNQSSFITEAIESAFVQDYSNKEIIVSDDCSNDMTYERIKHFEKYNIFRYNRNRKNIGRVANYHLLLYNLSSGKWIINLDGDDYFSDSSYISKAIYYINQFQDVAMVFGDQLVYDQSNNSYYKETNSDLPFFINGNDLFLLFPKNKIRMPHLSILYNKEKAIKTGFYTKNILSSDWESFLKLMINNKVIYLQSIAGVWRKHTNNETKTIDINKLITNLELSDYIIEFVEKHKIFTEKELINWKEDMCYRLSKGALSTILHREGLSGKYNFFKALYRQRRSTFYKLLFDIKTCIELILSFTPSIYGKVERVYKKF